MEFLPEFASSLAGILFSLCLQIGFSTEKKNRNSGKDHKCVLTKWLFVSIDFIDMRCAYVRKMSLNQIQELKPLGGLLGIYYFSKEMANSTVK